MYISKLNGIPERRAEDEQLANKKLQHLLGPTMNMIPIQGLIAFTGQFFHLLIAAHIPNSEVHYKQKKF